MRFLVAISVALLAFAGAAAWVVDSEPDWYLRARYPLEYEHIVSAHAQNYDLDPTLLAAVIYAESRFDPDVESEAGADRDALRRVRQQLHEADRAGLGLHVRVEAALRIDHRREQCRIEIVVCACALTMCSYSSG